MRRARSFPPTALELAGSSTRPPRSHTNAGRRRPRGRARTKPSSRTRPPTSKQPPRFELYASNGASESSPGLLGRLIDVASRCRRSARPFASSWPSSAEPPATTPSKRCAAFSTRRRPGRSGRQLSQLYEKAGRDEELAEALDAQIALAKERGDAAAELVAHGAARRDLPDRALGDARKSIETYQAVLVANPSTAERSKHWRGCSSPKASWPRRARRSRSSSSVSQGATPSAIRRSVSRKCSSKLKDEPKPQRALERGPPFRLRRTCGHPASDWRRPTRKRRTGPGWPKLDWRATPRAASGTTVKTARIPRGRQPLPEQAERPGAARRLLEKASALARGTRDCSSLCDAYSAAGRSKERPPRWKRSSLRSPASAPRSWRPSTSASRAPTWPRATGARAHRARPGIQDRPRFGGILKDLGKLSIEDGRSRARAEDVPRAAPAEARRQLSDQQGRSVLPSRRYLAPQGGKPRRSRCWSAPSKTSRNWPAPRPFSPTSSGDARARGARSHSRALRQDLPRYTPCLVARRRGAGPARSKAVGALLLAR